MSWELVQKLKQHFPAVEPFPHEGQAPPPPAEAEESAPVDEGGAAGAGEAQASDATGGGASSAPPSSEEASAAPAESEAAAGTAESAETQPRPAPGRPAPTRLPPKREAHGPEKPLAHLTPGAWVPRDSLRDICEFVALDPEFSLDYLSFVTGVDYLDQGQLEVVYHLFSMDRRHELLLKVKVPRDDAKVDSVSKIWATAIWHEREAYDLLGITFEGHPDLRRIMMTEDWAGHPLRKDYVYEDPEWLVEVARVRQEEIQGLGLGERS